MYLAIFGLILIVALVYGSSRRLIKRNSWDEFRNSFIQNKGAQYDIVVRSESGERLLCLKDGLVSVESPKGRIESFPLSRLKEAQAFKLPKMGSLQINSALAIKWVFYYDWAENEKVEELLQRAASL